MTEIINGKKIAKEIIDELKKQPVPQKIFAAILVGDDKISENFLGQKERTAKELGIDFRIYRFFAKLKNDDLRKEIGKIANLKKAGGVIVQMPLPEHINRYYILNVIPREKDVDVLGERALGAFYADRNPILPPAVGVVEEIIKDLKLKIKDFKIAVVGAGFLIGKPIAVWLINNKIKELKIFEKGSDLTELKNYDLTIAGTGQSGIIKPEMLKENAVIIDFGYFIDENKKISGDFDATNIKSEIFDLKSVLYTPTPGGTGKILTAKIFENFYKLNSQ